MFFPFCIIEDTPKNLFDKDDSQLINWNKMLA